jgi:hypothetical protein
MVPAAKARLRSRPAHFVDEVRSREAITRRCLRIDRSLHVPDAAPQRGVECYEGWSAGRGILNGALLHPQGMRTVWRTSTRSGTPPLRRLADDASAQIPSSLARRPKDTGSLIGSGSFGERIPPPVQWAPPFHVICVLTRDAGWPAGHRGLGGATTVVAGADPAVGEPRIGPAGRSPRRREVWWRVPRRASVRCSRAWLPPWRR